MTSSSYPQHPSATFQCDTGHCAGQDATVRKNHVRGKLEGREGRWEGGREEGRVLFFFLQNYRSMFIVVRLRKKDSRH